MTQATAGRARRADDFGGRGVVLSWPEFVHWLNGLKTGHRVGGELVRLPPAWKPGQHWALIGKTQEGKTNFACAVLEECRDFVLALDPKGADETLSKSGWERVAAFERDDLWWRLRHRTEVRQWDRIWQRIDEGRPVRIIVGHESRTTQGDLVNKQLMRQAIEFSRQTGGFSVYVDEHQVATDPRMLNLGPPVARIAVSAASAGTSLMTTMQYLSWSEKAPVRQSSLVSFWKTRNRDLLRKISDETGRSWQELAALSDELPKWHMATLSDDVRSPVIVTRPPKIG